MCGSVVIITYITILGYLEYVDNQIYFIILSFAARILGGIGAGANSTACMAILISFDSVDREKYIGLIEASLGLGLLLGPPIGSGFYVLGGYKAPFLAFGKLILICAFFFQKVAVYVVSYPFIVYNLYKSEKILKD
jgi:MFS family permease